MNKEIVLRFLFFILLILLQVLVFSNMFIGGYVPYIYVLFIILFPIRYDKTLFLISSFLLGLSMDFFCSSGGVHAAACVVSTYIRPFALKFSFGRSYEYQTIKLAHVTLAAKTAYFFILILTHHLIMFLLETFNASFILFSLKTTFFTTIYSTLLSLILVSLFNKK